MTLIHRRVLFLCVLIAFVLTGCGALQLGAPDDPPELKRQKAYMAARKEFALTLKQYNDHYDITPAATQAIWREKYDPLFDDVDDALTSWKMALDKGFDPDSQEQLYLDLKSKLLLELVNVFGKE